MADGAVSFLDFMEGTLKELAIPIGTDMHIRNVSAHVRNALYHCERTPEVDAAAGQLISLAQQFGRRFDGIPIGDDEKADRKRAIDGLNEAYLALRKLIDDARPSRVSIALGL